jgi:hypothetical protein
MISISGVLERGLDCAHRSIALQLPDVIKEFPELAGCYPGTLNLRLEEPLIVVVPDHRTKPIAWVPDSPDVTEVFDFLRIRLEAPVGRPAIPAWFYVAHRSQHRANLRLQEVVAPRKLKIAPGTKCRIHIDRPTIKLPPYLEPVVLILARITEDPLRR